MYGPSAAGSDTRLIRLHGGFELLDLRLAEHLRSRQLATALHLARALGAGSFGGGEIRVPRTWTVIVKGVGIFGAYSDETHQEAVVGAPTKTLIVKGMAVFGGVEIKN